MQGQTYLQVWFVIQWTAFERYKKHYKNSWKSSPAIDFSNSNKHKKQIDAGQNKTENLFFH